MNQLIDQAGAQSVAPDDQQLTGLQTQLEASQEVSRRELSATRVNKLVLSGESDGRGEE